MAGLWSAPGVVRGSSGGPEGAAEGVRCAPAVWLCARPCALVGPVSKRFHGACVGRPAALDSAGWGTLPPHSPRAADRPGRCVPSPGPSAGRGPAGRAAGRGTRVDGPGACARLAHGTGPRNGGARRWTRGGGGGAPMVRGRRMAGCRRSLIRWKPPRERSSGGLNMSDGASAESSRRPGGGPPRGPGWGRGRGRGWGGAGPVEGAWRWCGRPVGRRGAVGAVGSPCAVGGAGGGGGSGRVVAGDSGDGGAGWSWVGGCRRDASRALGAAPGR